MMKLVMFLATVFVLCIKEDLGSPCPRTSKRPGSECVDECNVAIGCSDPKKECRCDGDCGFSCVKRGMRCKDLKRLRNGNIIGNDRTFNSTLRFECNPKYTLFGARTRRCRAKGLWDGKKTRCKISCPDPGIPNHVNRDRKQNTKGFTEKTTLQYECFPGYETTDSLSIKCQNNGQWSSSPPVCRVQQCGRVVLPANSHVRSPRGWKNSGSHQLGKRIYLSCKPGYQSPLVFGIMRCDRNGWRLLNSRFVCNGRSCGDPGTPRNGKKTGLSYTLNDAVQYTCDDCFKISGVDYRRCLADGTWSDELPSCRRVTCPPPSSLPHGKRRLSSRPIYCGSYVDYECAIGYNLKGSSKRTCLSDGNWSDRAPLCEIVDCGDPGVPENGVTNANGGFTYGNDATFSCNSNYVLEGSSLATCQTNGKWSKSLPSCLEKCSDPSGNTNARVIGEEFYHGKEVEFVCPRDSILVPSRPRKLTCQNGEWRGTIPSCKASCPILPRLSDGRKRGESRTHGSSVLFYCNRGHQLVGQSRVQCDDGNWSSEMPRCLAICKTIRSITNGWVDGRGNLEGNVLRFRCRRDYVLEGEPQITCTENRRWSAAEPTCRAPCRRLNSPVHGRIIKQGYKHNEEIRFKCDLDYHLQGKNVLLCSNRQWDGNVPKCLAPCRKYGVQPFPGGYIKRNGFRHNEEVIFGCRDPFVIDGEDTSLRCDNGDWQGQLPSCGEPCRNLSVPRNGKKIKDGYKHGDEVVFRCNRGFQMVGTSSRLCNFGIWNNNRIPRCERKCPDPSKDTNARVVGDQFYNGMEVEFICSDDGVLEPEISKKLTCKNGRWDGIMPWCKAPCPPLPQIRNGVTRYPNDRRRHGDIALSTCNQGYQQRGSIISQCNNGVWSEKIPRCLAICRPISFVRNGRISAKGKFEDDEITFFCDPNYSLEGEKVIRCTNTGKWNASAPTCKFQVRSPSISTTPTTNMITTIGQPKVCKNITKLRKGRVKGTGVSPGSKRIFSCSKNWELSGSKEITCLDNGKWSGPQPKCKLGGPVINCAVVGKIKGGYAKRNESFHGGRVVFVCYPNYTMSTTKPGMLCRSGKWSQKPHPKCYAPCETPVAPQNGFISKISGRKHEDFIIFSCNQHYTLSGSATLQCQDGTWSDPPPICQPTK
ncbi:sushi, von Willebrand factor type A, EGF and pentraxin domain-containing protein 1-like [Dendronephthya gigantea]|uniref:sushi, von Willebrand factor type A, EGF and pentraxin domain-containing protein 1-like n=1 Tax=Dendronephthya gigantea TaxID=151771 RepID=UPI00106AEBD7|nr:sushi, von Willebrand factor type A, EGF and pentraxin domain-containing protein 1-like [Dendronephthya gigantea]XP_028394558.1 sushi, von Willebrand factor type A, EGF and pentraxin domain-containing protein 1-like [Dendronephthya gigantea]